MAELVYDRYGRPYYWYYPDAFISQVVYAVIGIIQFMLGFRLVLSLLGANASSQFVAWVFDITNRLAAPFLGAFPALSVGGFTIELSIIFAMIGYAIIAWLLAQLLSLISSSIYRIA